MRFKDLRLYLLGMALGVAIALACWGSYQHGILDGKETITDTEAYCAGYKAGKLDMVIIIMNECQYAPSPIKYGDSTILVQYHPLIK